MATPHFTIMQLEDVPEVLILERASFTSPWTETTFQHEVKHNTRAFYFVLRSNPDGAQPDDSLPPLLPLLPPILAYGGYWVLGDEAHIVTIATHPVLRRRGFGELMLLHLIDRARESAITAVTLEVRAGNTAAQALYTKWGFVQVGLRKRYYRDNDEDALLLTLYDVDKPAVWEPLAAALARLEGTFGETDAA